ncbi:hypothetical protein BU15DRAFT_32134, partial [Melanogaster broomeanus]
MTLPKNMPTLEALATKNWTRPDNVFCTDNTAELFINCYTEPKLCGPRTDHVPILSIIEMEALKVEDKQTRNYHDVDWKEFQDALLAKLAKFPTERPITTDHDLQNTARNFTRAITDTIDTHVPMSRPSPHAKRWWSRDLSNRRKEVQAAAARSYQMRHLQDHPSHEEHRVLRNRY